MQVAMFDYITKWVLNLIIVLNKELFIDEIWKSNYWWYLV